MNGLRWPDWQAWVCRSLAFNVVAVVLAVLTVLVAGYFVRLREPHLAYVAAAAQLLAAQEAREGRESQLAGQGDEQRALEDAEQLLRIERWRLAAGEGMSEWLDALAISGHEHGLLFERLDVLEEHRQPGYQLTPLEVRVKGRYPALRAWLEQGHRQLRLVNVSRLRLEAASEGSDLVVGQLLLNSYSAGEALPLPMALALAHEPAQEAWAMTALDPFQAWSLGRPGNGLARIPLDQLEMVGSLAREGRHEALLRSGGHIYRVKEGEPLGRDDGVVMAISRDQMTVRERIYIGDVWQERQRYLALGKRASKEVKDETEAVGERDAGHAGGDAGGAGGGG